MVLSISSAEGSFKILTARGWGYEEWPFIEAGRLLTRLFSRTVGRSLKGALFQRITVNQVLHLSNIYLFLFIDSTQHTLFIGSRLIFENYKTFPELYIFKK